MEDADWATSDKPVILCGDGCVRVYDSGLKTCNSVLNLLDTEGGTREGRRREDRRWQRVFIIRWRREQWQTCSASPPPSEPVFCPQMVLPQASLRLKAMLQHQPWNLEYSLDPAE